MRPGESEDGPPDSGNARFPYAAVLWDLDGTLVDSEPVHRRSFLDTGAAFGLALPGDFHDRLIGMSEEAIHRTMVESYGLDAPLSRWTERRFEAFLARIGEVRPIGHAQELWRMLAAIGIRQAIVSNGPRPIVRANVGRLGLSPDEVLTISRDDVAKGKPAPDPYLLAAKRLTEKPTGVAVVEDSLSGLNSAHAAGMSVFMMPGFHGGEGRDWQPVEVLHRAARRCWRRVGGRPGRE
jgi:beta-phosphoglucomutase-like phosphatase (HAD superfamily)